MRNGIIKKIELDLGGKRVSLTLQQARNLKDALDELFGKEIIKVREKDYIPYPQPYYPIKPWREPIWKWEREREPYYFFSSDTICKYESNNNTLSLTGL